MYGTTRGFLDVIIKVVKLVYGCALTVVMNCLVIVLQNYLIYLMIKINQQTLK